MIRTVNPKGTFRRKTDKLNWVNDDLKKPSRLLAFGIHMPDELKYSLNHNAEFILL